MYVRLHLSKKPYELRDFCSSRKLSNQSRFPAQTCVHENKSNQFGWFVPHSALQARSCMCKLACACMRVLVCMSCCMLR